MLEITTDNCHKCDLETINASNSQYFWINRRYFQKLKANVTGKLFLISVKTHRDKNIAKN